MGALAGLVLVAGGCSGSETGGDETTPKPDPKPETIDIINVAVDSNRDGKITNDEADQLREDEWSSEVGAVFLANLDDDDNDKKADFEDEVVNGVNDELDLARIRVVAWPEVPKGAVGFLYVDEVSQFHIRIFRREKSGQWTRVAGGNCGDVDTSCQKHAVSVTNDDIKNGAEFGIEGQRFYGNAETGWAPATVAGGQPTKGWDGIVQIHLAVVDAKGNPLKTDKNPTGEDLAKMRVSPWMQNHNLRDFDLVYYNDFSKRLTDSFPPPLTEAGVAPYVVADQYDIVNYQSYGDIWFEDWFQTGWTAMPTPDGAVDPDGDGIHGMNIFNPRPWGRPPCDPGPGCDVLAYHPATFLRKHFLGADNGVAVLYNEKTETQSGTTYDSHGNHEALPPWKAFPAGRILHGSGVMASTQLFYQAQGVQPPVVVTTSWLVVGHTDEVFSSARAKTETGFKVLQNTPKLGRELFQQWEKDGFGAAKIFEGNEDPFNGITWVKSVTEVNAWAELQAWNQESQTFVDKARAELMQQTGLTDADFIEIPVLYEQLGSKKVAWVPDTANIRVVDRGNTLVFAKTFGPIQDGKDLSKEWLEQNLGVPASQLGEDGMGAKVRFADSWWYHLLLGDVHCASNWSGKPTAGDERWWTGATDTFGPFMSGQ
jgi:protein-arginine deiminase